MDQDTRSAQREEARLLAEIGRSLFAQDLEVEVALPTELATSAVAAWNREDCDETTAQGKSDSQRLTRQRAGALALIGLAVEKRGVVEGDLVHVKIDAWQIGNALDAAEQSDLL